MNGVLVARHRHLARYPIGEAEHRRVARQDIEDETADAAAHGVSLQARLQGCPEAQSLPIRRHHERCLGRLAYASLVANAIMLSNVAGITEALAAMAEDGHPVIPGLVACPSPYMRKHIRCFGQYVLDMDVLRLPLNPPQPLPFELAL